MALVLCQEDGREISGIYGCFEYKSDFYCKGNAVLINYVESIKDSVVEDCAVFYFAEN